MRKTRIMLQLVWFLLVLLLLPTDAAPNVRGVVVADADDDDVVVNNGVGATAADAVVASGVTRALLCSCWVWCRVDVAAAAATAGRSGPLLL